MTRVKARKLFAFTVSKIIECKLAHIIKSLESRNMRREPLPRGAIHLCSIYINTHTEAHGCTYTCTYSAVIITYFHGEATDTHTTHSSRLLCAVCQRKERTFETRSLSAESWQSCWTTRRACLTPRTMTSPPPTITAPSTNRYCY